MIGRALSHYKILSEISRGGMGIVYRALDLKLDREVALKVLPPELVTDVERKRRFVQEAKAAAKLDHPHIGMVFEIDEADGTTFIAMELIRGEQLRDTIAKGPVPLRRALEIATDIAEGLAQAHEKRVVHRDLKPANIMVAEDGHTKIIDFGLAKLVEPLRGEGSDLETAFRGKTDPGKVMGTVSYMSPEQARGESVDHRTDIFSFGMVVYEMLTGEPPFKAPSGPETLSAIINAPMPSLSSNISGDVGPEVERIVAKCLAKDRAERYQTMKDLIVDLRVVRRRLESGATTPVASPARRRPWLYIGTGAVAALLLVGALLLFFQPFTREEAPVPRSKPSIAILFFDNNSGDPSLDWLRTALTDMLITDLSQSPQVEVLSTDTLYQILSEMNRLDERVTSLEVVQEVAKRGNVETAVLGSFVKAGDTIRISVRLQEARTGKILSTEKVEGEGESSIFPMVDDLTRRIKMSFEIPALADSELDMDIRDVTSSSIEAYQYYVEGRNIHLRGDHLDAIPFYEKAVELDPGFAMAFRGLAAVHAPTDRRETEKYGRLAFENAERLTIRERYFVEGYYYWLNKETWDRAIQALEKLLELYPDTSTAQYYLAGIYRGSERFDKAIENYEEMRRRKYAYPQTYGLLAGCYSQRGHPDRGYQALQDFLSWYPDNWQGYYYLGEHLTNWGKLDEALEAFEKGDSLRPGAVQFKWGRWLVSILREDWEQAEAAAKEMATWEQPTWRLKGHHSLAATRLYHGHSQNGLGLLEQATAAPGDPTTAILLLEQGQAAHALVQAQRAQLDSWGPDSLVLTGLAQAKLGHWDEAESTAEELRTKAESLPTEKEKRGHHHLLGELALARGDLTRSVEELEKAQSMLPYRGPIYSGYGVPPHVRIWYSLASALLAAGDEDKAAQKFQLIIESTTEHIFWPIPYVRSFYFLGKIHENRGEMDKAREYYRRFYEYWKDGDIDRERVEEARKKLAS